MKYRIRQMTMADYAGAYALWKKAEGLCLEESDSAEAIAIYLKRNRGLCFVACDGDRIVGTLLCGHDGRRGVLRHLTIDKSHRHNGIARAMIDRTLPALAKAGIAKCNAFVLDANVQALRFWDHLGWYGLDDNYRLLQTPTTGGQ
jgi:ribosomal protein S18 acetylase RimI-like enzyme